MLDPAWLEGKKGVCITAGASTPEDLVAGRGREEQEDEATSTNQAGHRTMPWF